MGRAPIYLALTQTQIQRKTHTRAEPDKVQQVLHWIFHAETCTARVHFLTQFLLIWTLVSTIWHYGGTSAGQHQTIDPVELPHQRLG